MRGIEQAQRFPGAGNGRSRNLVGMGKAGHLARHPAQAEAGIARIVGGFQPAIVKAEGLAGGELQEQFAIIAVRQRAADQRLRLCGVELAIEQAARIEAQWPAPASTKRLSQ